MGSVTLSGYSDDLIYIRGAITEEWANGEREVLIAFSDGTVLRIGYHTIWRIDPVTKGSAELTITKCPEDDETNYSDRAELTGDIRWAVLGTDIALADKS